MEAISFFVVGEPKAQPRPRAFGMRVGGQIQTRIYNPGSAEYWKGQIALAAKDHIPTIPIEGPIRLDIAFLFPRPASHYRTGKFAGQLRDGAPGWHISKPDRDNLDKAVMDALKTLGFFRDDSQVCCGSLIKQYALGGPAGAEISIRPLRPSPAEAVHEMELAPRMNGFPNRPGVGLKPGRAFSLGSRAVRDSTDKLGNEVAMAHVVANPQPQAMR